MREEEDELARLNRRIADLRTRIGESKSREGHAWGRSAHIEILDLLNRTLKDLEARKATIERLNR